MNKNSYQLYNSNKENHQLTREAIETALLILLKEKKLEEISITELVRRAGVGRNSFYRNYDSKLGILKSMLKERFEDLAYHNVYRYSKDKEAGLVVIFNFIKQNKDFYKVLIKDGLQSILEEEIYNYQPNAGSENCNTSYYKSCLISSGMSRLLVEWLKNDCSDPVDELINMLRSLL